MEWTYQIQFVNRKVLANGRLFYPNKGAEIRVVIQDKVVVGLALVMPLSKIDILFADDFLRQV